MKHLHNLPKFFIALPFFILCCQFSFSEVPGIKQHILGKWKYVSHIYFSVGRYGPKEVDPIKSSTLCFKKDKLYFTDITFIDTCYYPKLRPKAFFDREGKKPHYLLDGPLAIRYTEQQLSKFVRINMNCTPNDFVTFYLNADTLILDSTGGVTFFFTKDGN